MTTAEDDLMKRLTNTITGKKSGSRDWELTAKFTQETKYFNS